MGNLYLIGFMGAGKTTVGRVLAEKTRRPFVDLDEEIERETGLSIPEFFARYGEEAFRKVEQHILARIARRDGCIVALGGGTPLSDQAWQLLRATGWSVYLRVNPQVLYQRLKGVRGRPLLHGFHGSARARRIKSLLREREPWYRRADFTLSGDHLLPETLAEMILDAWSRRIARCR